MPGRIWIFLGAVLAAVGVAAGAVGAHILEAKLKKDVEVAEKQSEQQFQAAQQQAKKTVTRYETAVRYHLLHALGLLLVGGLIVRSSQRMMHLAAVCFVIGLILFCGLLYALVFTDGRYGWMVAVVPYGGSSFILGWLILAAASLRPVAAQEKTGGPTE